MIKRVKVHYYTFVYTVNQGYSGATQKETVALPNIRSLARYLNQWKIKHPNYRILVAFLSESNAKFIKVVKFLQAEYAAQRFLVGYKERVLAHALESGYDLKWSHGLKPIQVKDDILVGGQN